MAECGAYLAIGDDHGDNSASMVCQLPEGHDGVHREVFQRNDKPVTVTWHGDERVVCCVCGKKAVHMAMCWECCRDICVECSMLYQPSDGHKSTPELVLSERRCPNEHSEACYAKHRRLEAREED